MSNYLISKIVLSELEWGFEKSDHASVLTSIQLGLDAPIGPGLTKVNSAVLDDPINLAKGKSGLNEMLSQMPNEWNPHMKLEFVKVSIRSTITNLVGRIRKELRNDIMEHENTP